MTPRLITGSARFLILVLALGLALVCLGCSAFEAPAPPGLPPLPKTLVAAPALSELTITRPLLELVKDDTARALVAEALENNHDLSATALRLKSAGLLLSRTKSARLPRVDGGYAATRNTLAPDSQWQTRHKISFSLSWEMDLWGRLALDHTAMEQDFQARQQTHVRAMDTLAARVLQSWFRVKANRMHLEIQAKQVGICQTIEHTVLGKYTLGLGDLQDITSARAKTNMVRAGHARAKQTYQQSVRSLELMLGRYPGARLDCGGRLPDVDLPAPRAPAAILARRPDVRAALKKAQSARSHAMASHRKQLPALTLTGDLFRDNGVLGRMGASPNSWHLAGDLLFPLFNAGRLADEAGAADATAQAVYRELARVVLGAMKEAEEAFARETRLKEQLNFMQRALDDARKSSRYYQERFKQGLASIIELQTARDRELGILSDLVDLKAERIINRVDMALALGTGVMERSDNENS